LLLCSTRPDNKATVIQSGFFLNSFRLGLLFNRLLETRISSLNECSTSFGTRLTTLSLTGAVSCAAWLNCAAWVRRCLGAMCPVLQHQRVFASIALVVRDHHGCEIRAKADFVHSLRMGEPTPAMTDLKNTSAPPKPSRTAFDTATGFGLAGSPGCDSLPSSIGDA